MWIQNVILISVKSWRGLVDSPRDTNKQIQCMLFGIHDGRTSSRGLAKFFTKSTRQLNGMRFASHTKKEESSSNRNGNSWHLWLIDCYWLVSFSSQLPLRLRCLFLRIMMVRWDMTWVTALDMLEAHCFVNFQYIHYNIHYMPTILVWLAENAVCM